MTLHLVKLSVGSTSVKDLERWQRQRLKRTGELVHQTRNAPRRAAEVLDGGSIYWVIRGLIQVRQRVLGLEPRFDSSGGRNCAIVLDPELALTRPTPHRAIQGWRYMEPDEAPADIAAGDDIDAMPSALQAELRALGLL